MNLLIEAEKPPLSQWDDGSIRVGNTRVTLETVIWIYRQSRSAEDIAHSFPSLKLADVHAVISYYLHHQPEIDEYVAQVEREGERIRKEIEAKNPPDNIRERLMARKKAMENKP